MYSRKNAASAIKPSRAITSSSRAEEIPTCLFSMRFMCFMAVGLSLAIAPVGRADITTQYNFEGNLLDTAAGGTTADNLTATTVIGPLATSYYQGIIGQAVLVSRNTG